jgi:hypothetical protein
VASNEEGDAGQLEGGKLDATPRLQRRRGSRCPPPVRRFPPVSRPGLCLSPPRAAMDFAHRGERQGTRRGEKGNGLEEAAVGYFAI